MDYKYWRKQASDMPLFADLLWSRPENRTLAGKLLIVGGNSYGLAAPAAAYNEALQAGVGEARVLLPDSLRATVGHTFAAGEFAPSTPSGSLSQKALAELLPAASWADGVLLAGDLGRNSETAILLEKFAAAYHGPLIITKDAADYFTAAPQSIVARPGTTLVLSFAQLQRLATGAHFSRPFRFAMDALHLVETLHTFTTVHAAAIVVKHAQAMFVASQGAVSSTRLTQDMEFWRVKTAAHTAVWQLQNPQKPFEALTTAVYHIATNKKEA
ncbi:MAG TPA: hypothetical protein VHC98_02135 [Candidatus Saccharimonadales bacterium]|nr:hypothetical protein [Candidatus Saccharimonadales bacterium]